MNIMRFRNIYFTISLLFLIPGIVSLLIFGLRPAIDFTGGSLLEVGLVEKTVIEEANIEQPSDSGNTEVTTDETATTSTQTDTEPSNSFTAREVESVLSNLYEVTSVQDQAENRVIVRGKSIDNDLKNQALVILTDTFGEVEEVQFSTVGPTFGRETLVKMSLAVLLVSFIITFYVWYQFNELRYGICAILAMFHDSLILLGAFSILGYFFNVEVDLLFVTALLTTLSFSIHDTIVVYDRIRELLTKHRSKSFESVVNAAVLETLARSINNSVTIIVMLLALVLLGGATIKWFAVALLIGAVTGTYSSTFTAAPLLLLWEEMKKKRASK